MESLALRRVQAKFLDIQRVVVFVPRIFLQVARGYLLGQGLVRITSRGHRPLMDATGIGVAGLALLPQAQVLHMERRRLLDLLNRVEELEALVRTDDPLQRRLLHLVVA